MTTDQALHNALTKFRGLGWSRTVSTASQWANAGVSLADAAFAAGMPSDEADPLAWVENRVRSWMNAE